VVRVSSDGPRHARCVLIEIPVPTGVTLHPGAAISLTVCIAGSPITLRIPAAGHIHSATCNHKSEPIRGGMESCPTQVTLLLSRLHWLQGAPRRRQTG